MLGSAQEILGEGKQPEETTPSLRLDRLEWGKATPMRKITMGYHNSAIIAISD